jgi:hypothetical protein
MIGDRPRYDGLVCFADADELITRTDRHASIRVKLHRERTICAFNFSTGGAHIDAKGRIVRCELARRHGNCALIYAMDVSSALLQ